MSAYLYCLTIYKSIMCLSMVNKFRNGIFSLRTRRFGSVAEIMIKKLYGYTFSGVLNYDLFDSSTNQRIEVKFATAIIKNDQPIDETNIVSQCIQAEDVSKRVISSYAIADTKFDCNIQQIKCKEFDVMYYGIFFFDCVQIFKITNQEVLTIPGYSNKQHRGNAGEGQFHINNDTFSTHQKNLIKQLSYKELYNLLK